jgi:lysophospholipase L1-like esterase
VIRPLLAFAVLLTALPVARAADPFEFKDGDRVVFIGSTLIEREQRYGYWELALTLKNRDKNVTFRNLGWSGDTVWGEARNGFDNNPKGFERLVSLTKELKPTVIVVCYGHNESFDGEAGIEKFTKQLEKLLDALAATKARIVLMSPTPFEKVAPLTDAELRNKNLALYRDAIKSVAGKRELEFVDAFANVQALTASEPRTENGLHMAATGYQNTASAVAGYSASSAEEIRKKIIDKNQLFFHRWRPQNETYLLGFRKHEQGKNAVEIAEFDPLVAAMEKEIAELKKALK